MANSVDVFTPEYWTASIQAILTKTLVARAVASFEEQKYLVNGDKINKPYAGINEFSVNDYTRGTNTTAQDIGGGNEYLEVATSKEITIYFDKLDQIQNKYDVVNERLDHIAYLLKSEIDGDFFDEVANAGLYIDDGSIAGTAGNPITVTTANVITSFSTAKATMFNANVPNYKPLMAVITHDLASIIEQSALANGFNLADATIRNGYAGDFMGYKIHVSNNLRHVSTLVSSANYSADETVVINGVTFTFKAAPANAGEVDVGADEATSLENLAAAINGSAGAGTKYIALSTANRNLLKNARIVASEDGVHTVTLTASGKMVLSETSATAAFGDQIAHMYTGLMGSTSLVIQKDVTVQKNKSELKTGYSYLVYDLYGMKTFADGARTLLDMRIKSV